MKKYVSVIIMVIGSLGLNAQSGHQDDIQTELPILAALTDTTLTGTGVLMGQDASFTMDWQKVLGDQFLKLEFQNKRKSEDNKEIVFRATGYYKILNDSTVVGNWFDNRGMAFPLNGSIKENEMTILWGSDDTERGKTIYQYIKDTNRIIVEDFVLNDGQFYKFGSATYRLKD